MKMIGSALFLSLAVMAWIKGAHSEELCPRDLILKKADLARSPERLSRSEIKEDLCLLGYALRNGYGGRRFVPQKPFKGALRSLEELAQEPPTSSHQLCDSIADIFWKIPDNHLFIWDGNRVCGVQIRENRRRPSVGKNLAAESGNSSQAWHLSSVQVSSRTVPVLSITHFPDSEDAVWEGFSNAVQEMLDAPAVIIDMRGNYGGDDGRGRELAAALLGYSAPYYFDAIIKSQTPETIALLLNSTLRAKFSFEARGEAVPAYVQEDIEERSRLFRAALRGELSPEQTSSFSGSVGRPRDAFQGPIVVLVDSGCASSCEGTLLYLEGHPRMVSIGEATGGFVHFGDTGTLILPNSGFLVSIPTKYFKIEGHYYERTGIMPDVTVEVGADALESATDWLKGYFRAEQ